MSSRSIFIVLAAGAVATAIAIPDKPGIGKPNGDVGKTAPLGPIDYAKGIHLQTELGSFKIKRGGEALDDGVLDITFKGTVLVSGLEGQATVSGAARLEKEWTEYGKKGFHSAGVGTLHVKGEFEGIQFFGQDMTAHYAGTGVIQLYGEFNKKLDTGSFWYDENPDKVAWGTGGAVVTPRPRVTAAPDSQITIKNVTPKG